MGLPSTIFTKESNISGVEGLKATQIEYLSSVESGNTIAFQMYRTYDGDVFELASGSNYIKVQQAGTKFSLETETGNISGDVGGIVWDIVINNYDTVSHLYINNTYIGNVAKVSSTYTDMTVNGYMSWCKVYFDSTATETAILNGFQEYLPEMYYWAFDGVAVGYTRCDVSKFVTKYTLQKATEDLQSGSEVSNKLNVSLLNETRESNVQYNGVWSDDQLQSTYDPSIAFYNGTVYQQYLQDRFRVWLEYWDQTFFDPQFSGRVSNNIISRRKTTNSGATATIVAEDWVERVATTRITEGYVLENVTFVNNADTDDSILHQHLSRAKASTSNESKTIVTDGTFGPGGPFNNGYYDTCTSFVASSTTLEQSNGYVISFWLRGSATVTIPSGEIENISNSGWIRYEYKYKKNLSGQDDFSITGTFDIYNFNISSTGNNMINNSTVEYDWFKIIADEIDYVHPWCNIQESDSIWEELKSLAVASAGVYLGFDEFGRFIFQSGFVDRIPVDTVDTASTVGAKLEGNAINRLKVKGAYIIKDDKDHVVWNTSSANFVDAERLIGAGELWPNPETTGDEYIAKYKGIDS